MNGYKWSPALVLAVLFALHSTAANAESRIGTATSTRPNAEGIVGADTQTLSPGSELYANETVRTGSRGVADLVFIDRTNLSVGPTSEVLLDKFVYDPVGSSGSVVMHATRGAFRFVTGSQDHRVYRVNTPYGTLGVRGTTVEIVVKPQMVTKVRPDECIAQFRLEEGAGATFTDVRGRVHEMTEVGACVCVLPSGAVTTGICPPLTQFAFGAAPPPPPPPPPGGGGCVTHCSPVKP